MFIGYVMTYEVKTTTLLTLYSFFSIAIFLFIKRAVRGLCL